MPAKNVSQIQIRLTENHIYLSGMSFGTSISFDFLWSIVTLSLILLDEITSTESSYMVLDISHPYTFWLPPSAANKLAKKNQGYHLRPAKYQKVYKCDVKLHTYWQYLNINIDLLNVNFFLSS